MNETEFRRFLGRVSILTAGQQERLESELRRAAGAREGDALVSTKGRGRPSCPACRARRAFRWGFSGKTQRWRCGDCGRTFGALTGTGLHRLRQREKWLAYCEQLALGTSVQEAADAVGIHRNTSFRWRHRFLAGPQILQARNLAGIVEADETYFLESFKGRKDGMPRAPRKRGGKAKKPGLSKEQIPVLVARERGGATSSAVLKDTTAATILEALRPILSEEAILCTDGNTVYESVAEACGVPLRAVNIAAGVRVLDGVFHVQNVNGCCSRLKAWMRRFNGVATRHLDNYLGWRRMLERLKGGDPIQILESARVYTSTNKLR